MQQATTNGQPGKRSADYVTIVAQACAKVTGFAQLYKDTMATIMVFNRRGPPADWQAMAKELLACIQ